MAKTAETPKENTAPENQTSHVPAPSISERAVANIQMVGGRKFVAVRQLSRPTLKFEEGSDVIVTFVQAITPPEKDDEGKVVINNNMPSPWTAIVTDVETGEEKNLVLNKVFVGNLLRTYPNDGYVNKTFAAHKHKKLAGKRYNDIEIVELQEVQ